MKKRRWQATTLDHPRILTMDDAIVQSICLTQRQAAICKAAIALLYFTERWIDLSLDGGELQKIMAEIDWRLDGGCTMFRLRQNPDDPCLLEQSFDSGETWETAFNYTLCSNTDALTIINIWNETNLFNIDQDTTYNGDIINIYPTWEYDGTPSDAERDAALCEAITQWVDMICEFIIMTIENGNAETEDQAQFWSDISYGMSAAALGLAVWGIYPVAALFAGTSLLLTAVVIDEISGWLMEDATPYRDVDARALVVCAMYNAMQGDTPTYAAWHSSLDEILTGNAEKIRQVVSDCNHAEMAFVNWLGLMADLIALGAGILGNTCDECQGFDHAWLFSVASGSAEHTTYDNDSPQWTLLTGYYDLVEGGLISVDENNDPVWHDRLNIRIYFGSRTITRIRVRSDYLEGFVAPGHDDQSSIIIYTISDTETVRLNEPLAYQVDGIEEWVWEGLAARVTGIRIMWRCSYAHSEFYGDGHVHINEIAVEGQGDCPFD